MNITIDCRMIGLSGVGAYLKGCLPHFLDSQNNFLLIGKTEKLYPFIKERNNCIIEECNIKDFSLKELFAFPKKILKKINKTDIYYSPYFNIPSGIKIPIYTTIHDIIFPDMPEIVSNIGLKARMFFYRRAARLSAAIFTVSEFSKNRIERHLGKNIKVINASNAANDIYFNLSHDNITKKNTILFIGNIKKHKGLSILLDAFNNCRKEGLDYKLVILGSIDNFRSKDKEAADQLSKINKEDVIFIGFLSENEKIKLLGESSLLVQPSLYEGFGYPPLEALLSGTNALISDIPVFREVYGDFPVTFFRVGDSKDLKEKMMKLLQEAPSLPKLKDELLFKYTFGKTASIILDNLRC